MNKQWRLTRKEEGMLSQNKTSHHARRSAIDCGSSPLRDDLDATPSTSRKFEALGEFEKAKHAIGQISCFGMADKEEIGIYRVFLTELGILATAQAEKLLIIEEDTWR